MAIAEMQRISVLLAREDHDRLLRFAQRAGCIQFLEADPGEDYVSISDVSDTLTLDADIARTQWAITKLSKYDQTKQSMLRPLPEVERATLEETTFRQVSDIIHEVEELERRAGELHGEEARLRANMDQLVPWLKLDIPLEMLKDTQTTRVFTGYADAQGLSQLEEAWKGRPLQIQMLEPLRDQLYFLAYVIRGEAAAFLDDLKQIAFQHVSPGEGHGVPRAQYDQAQDALRKIKEQRQALDTQFYALGKKLPELRLAFEAQQAAKDREKAAQRFAYTGSAAYMSGWVPKATSDFVKQQLQAEFPNAVAAFTDPEPGEDPPVLLSNGPAARPFSQVVAGFSLPDYRAVDPTALMMPFFACFFGMMVSDAGYGLVMAILIPILIKIMKPSPGARRLFQILAIGGLMTIFWGALYNSWFGFSPWPSVFDPVNDSLPVMAVCIGLGAVHLFAGLGLGAYQNFRRGRPLDALYDQFSWMMLVIGLGLLFLPGTAAIGQWLAIAGVLIILVMAGRRKSNNPFKRLISGLGALYGVTGWISDLLSYVRLFGMGLATGVIGMVINQLVGMIMSSGIIGIIIGAVVFVGGHLFNAAINILGAYVHTCRLQYIEFFGKFFEEGGTAFTPLGYSPRYLRVKNPV